VSSGQVNFDPIYASQSQNIIDALNGLSKTCLIDPVPPAAGQTYDVDRRIGALPKFNHQFAIRLMQQILEKSDASGMLNDDDAKISFGTNIIFYVTMRAQLLKSGGAKFDKDHKDYKEGKRMAKHVLKRSDFRGNIIPWCQFANFEIVAGSVTNAMNEIYAQVLMIILKTYFDIDYFMIFYVKTYLQASSRIGGRKSGY